VPRIASGAHHKSSEVDKIFWIKSSQKSFIWGAFISNENKKQLIFLTLNLNYKFFTVKAFFARLSITYDCPHSNNYLPFADLAGGGKP
jgi:hypothetical protein